MASDDITFCFNYKCKNRSCKRNPQNIQIQYRDHNYDFFKDCEYWDVPEVYYSAQEGEKDAGS